MYNFEEYLLDLSQKCSIDFKIVSDNGQVLFNSIEDVDFDNLKSVELMLEDKKANLYVEDKFEICASVLKYSIENKYKEIFSLREKIFADILEGKSITTDALYNALPFLSSKCTLFLIYVEKNRYEVLNIIKEYYDREDVITFIYEDYIAVVGAFEDEADHAASIQDMIESNVFSSCYISYAGFEGDTNDFIKAYRNNKLYIEIGRKYNLKNRIYNNENLLFEKIIYNVRCDIKEEIYNKFKDDFSKFDNEMINTIEEFISEGLNISETAKKLYIHRNTLIYRLDKIAKDTGYDIRNFKQASIFTIAFLTWKEKNNEF